MSKLTDIIKSIQDLPKRPALIAIEDKVLILPNKSQEISKGGIIIPLAAQEKETKGIVIAVGEHTLNGTSMDVSVGDEVLYSKFAGQPLEYEGQEIRVIRHGDISLITQKVIKDED